MLYSTSISKANGEQLTSEGVHDWDDQMWLIDDKVGVTRPVTGWHGQSQVRHLAAQIFDFDHLLDLHSVAPAKVGVVGELGLVTFVPVNLTTCSTV